MADKIREIENELKLTETGRAFLNSATKESKAMAEYIDREQMIEDLYFLSDQRNYKSIKYAIECINKLEKIKQIVNQWNDRKDADAWAYRQIKKVLEKE